MFPSALCGVREALVIRFLRIVGPERSLPPGAGEDCVLGRMKLLEGLVCGALFLPSRSCLAFLLLPPLHLYSPDPFLPFLTLAQTPLSSLPSIVSIHPLYYSFSLFKPVLLFLYPTLPNSSSIHSLHILRLRLFLHTVQTLFLPSSNLLPPNMLSTLSTSVQAPFLYSTHLSPPSTLSTLSIPCSSSFLILSISFTAFIHAILFLLPV